MVSAWQLPQTVFRSPATSFAFFDACGLWQVRHPSPPTTGWWTRPFSSIAFTAVAWQLWHSAIPAFFGLNPAADPGASWHWLHMPFATGGCTLSMRRPRLSEPCGSWQLVQRDFATGYSRCFFAKMGLSVAWQRTHRPGTSAVRSDAAFAEPC